jgi:prepilin-type N-terminal cleavage/methylation domain-containing protein
MLRRTTAARRAGFSLIELLVAITIISILAGLLLVGISSARRSVRRTQAVNDIGQLAAACQKFKQDFGFNPPTEFVVPNFKDPNDANFQLLQRMFRSLQQPPLGATVSITFNAADGVSSWSGRTIRHDQCLIFFLAGPSGRGWNPIDPAVPPEPSSQNVKKYLDLTAMRVTSIATTEARIVDPWDTPYMYFASDRNGNYPIGPFNAANGDPVSPYRMSGNATNGTGSLPVNQGGVQIISAGPPSSTNTDRKPHFGPGSARVSAGPPETFMIWIAGETTASNFVAPYGPLDDGADDIANFNRGSALGIPTNP